MGCSSWGLCEGSEKRCLGLWEALTCAELAAVKSSNVAVTSVLCMRARACVWRCINVTGFMCTCNVVLCKGRYEYKRALDTRTHSVHACLTALFHSPHLLGSHTSESDEMSMSFELSASSMQSLLSAPSNTTSPDHSTGRDTRGAAPMTPAPPVPLLLFAMFTCTCVCVSIHTLSCYKTQTDRDRHTHTHTHTHKHTHTHTHTHEAHTDA